MRHEARRALMVAACMSAALLGCEHENAAARTRLLDSPAARSLVGAWDVTFRMDVATAVVARASEAAPITGTLVLAEDRYGRANSRDLDDPTHDGVYDVDFTPFGFSSRAAGDVPIAVARVAPAAAGDSLYVVLSPGTSRLSVQMAGRLTGDSAAGEWSASAFSAGGGAGTFTMRRHEPR
jgi:hypothetical protein